MKNFIFNNGNETIYITHVYYTCWTKKGLLSKVYYCRRLKGRYNIYIIYFPNET